MEGLGVELVLLYKLNGGVLASVQDTSKAPGELKFYVHVHPGEIKGHT